MIPFAPPRIDNKIIEEVILTLKSGWITTGPKTKLFEKKLTEYCGNKITHCVNSATSGLELVLRWFGVQAGDEVIIPAYAYCSIANAIFHCGAIPVMVDVNQDDFNISINSIASAITKKTKVIIPVDFAGFPCDYDEIDKLVSLPWIIKMFVPGTDVQKNLGRILVLSDAAHSLGARYKEKRTGALTDISVFSFHAVKNLTTSEGGAIAFNLPVQFYPNEIYRYFNIMSLHGQTKDAFQRQNQPDWKYDVIQTGYKANMPDILASIGLVELERYESETLPKRQYIFAQYDKAFRHFSWAELPVYKTQIRTGSYHLYPLRIRNITENIRDSIIQRIIGKGVSVNVHFQPLPMLTVFKELGYNIVDYPIAYSNYCREISLPVYYDLSDKDMNMVIDVVSNVVNSVL